jgi:hypothetical protein
VLIFFSKMFVFFSFRFKTANYHCVNMIFFHPSPHKICAYLIVF